MTNLRLIMATPENQLMNSVFAEWDKQLIAQSMPKSALDLVRIYESQLKPDKTDGFYVLCETDKLHYPKPPYEAFVHINHAFPKSPTPQLRLTWSRIAPCHEANGKYVEDHSRIYSSLIGNALTLSQSHLKSPEIKIYLYNAADRRYGRLFAYDVFGTKLMRSINLPFNVVMRGNWLQLNWV